MTEKNTFSKDYFEEGPYGKQNIQIIRRNYQLLLNNAKAANFLPNNPKRILDFGCAFGVGTLFLAEQFPKVKVVGVDISNYAIEKAKSHYKRRNIDYYCLDLCRPDQLNLLREKYNELDLIFTRDTLEHIAPDKQEKILATFVTLLKENGMVIAQTPNRLSPLLRGDKTHIGLRSAKSWKTLFQKFFREVRIFEKQYLPIVWKFKKNKELSEFPLPLFGCNIYIFGRGKTLKLHLQRMCE